MPVFPAPFRSERERIEFLLRRDGPDRARAWVQQTLASYREAVTNPHSHASFSEYSPRFERAIREFEEWLAAQD